MQISRILALKDPNVHIIYVMPFEITPDLQRYFCKLLEMHNVSNYKQRLTFITPEYLDRFPNTYSLTMMLMLSQKSLNFITSLIKQNYA